MRARGHVLVLALSLFFMISGAAAQENSSAQEEQTKNVLVQLDEATWISHINWNPENSSQIEVTVQSEIPKPIKIQEIPNFRSRSGSFSPMKSVTLSRGKNIITVEKNGGNTIGGVMGISITDSNNGAYYRKEPNSIPDPEPIDAPFLAFYGASSMYITFYLLNFMAKFKLKRGYIRE